MRALAAAFIPLVLAGCATDLFAAELDERGFAPVLFGDVDFFEATIVDDRTFRLHAEVYLPAAPLSAQAPARFPAILVLSPYWGNGTQGEPVGYRPYDWLVEELVPRGYAVVFGDLAGSGGSSGCWDFMGPVERASAVAMVEGVAAQPWSDGKVGMFGISYDGMSQIMAASDRAPHLVTVVPAAPLTHAYGGVLKNGVRYDWIWRAVTLHYEAESLLPVAGSRARFEGWERRLVDSPACVAENHAAELGLDAYSDYFRARDYRQLGPYVQASVFYIQGLRDFNVKSDNFGAWFEGVPTLKKAWIGNWLHHYPDAAHGGRDEIYVAIHRWFDHTLKGVDNGIDREPRFDVEDSLGRWRVADEWPPRDAAPLTFDLAPGGRLVPEGAGPGTASVGGAASLPSALPGQAQRGLQFASAPFERPTYVSGHPIVRLTLASDRPAGQVIVRLYEDGYRIAQGALDLTFRDGLDEPRPLTPREPVTVEVRLYALEHEVQAGRRLTLEVATHDPTSWFEDDLAAATLTLELGGASSLTLPTIDPKHP